MSFMKVKNGAAKAMADVIPGLGHFVFDDKVGTVFITSGSGVVGYRVALSLLKAGHKDVRVGMWKGDRGNAERSFGDQCAEVLQAAGATVVDFDWTNEAGKDNKEENRGATTVFYRHISNTTILLPYRL